MIRHTQSPNDPEVLVILDAVQCREAVDLAQFVEAASDTIDAMTLDALCSVYIDETPRRTLLSLLGALMRERNYL